MAYREAEKPKARTVKLILTRGEVHAIVRKHLRDTGKIPSVAPGTVAMAVLANEVAPPDVNGKMAPWDDWPAYALSWTENLDEQPDDGEE